MKQTPFDISKCTVRLAEPRDAKDLVWISKTIWNHGDYLGKVAKQWIDEPWFLVCEYQQRVIACIKLTLLPNESLWFEGMRVHGSYQGMGIGRLMNQAAMKLAYEITPQYQNLKYEFSTYRLNQKTIHITTKIGFKLVEGFYTLEHRGICSLQKPKIITKPSMDIFELYPLYLPAGWRAVHNEQVSLPFICKHAKLFASPSTRYLLSGHDYRDLTVLDVPPEDIKAELPYIQSMVGFKKSFNIILPQSQKHAIPSLQEAGFRFMDANPELTPDLLVFKM